MTEKEIIDMLRIGNDIEITIRYNGASSMHVVLDKFFPCKVKDLTTLLKTVKLDHADRARHIQVISAFLQNRVYRCKAMLIYHPEEVAKISKLQRKYDKNLEKVISISSKWKGIAE